MEIINSVDFTERLGAMSMLKGLDSNQENEASRSEQFTGNLNWS